MSSYTNENPYQYPGDLGLVLVGSVEWREWSYEFDLTVVWQELETNQFLWASDSGCSCPLPFDGFTLEGLNRGNKYDVLNYLASHYNSAKAMNLIEKIQAQ